MITRSFTGSTVSVNGRDVGVIDDGQGGLAVVFLHGGAPGSAPYTPSADAWLPLLSALRLGCRIVAIDLPGAGATRAAPEELLVDGTAARVGEILTVLGVESAVLVPHGVASLAAFSLARAAVPAPRISGVCAIAPLGAAPTGDAASNITLLHPPRPAWTAECQRWALGRLCHRAAALSPSVVDAMAEAAQGTAHREAVAFAGEDGFQNRRTADLIASRAAFNGYCRDVGYETPMSLVWGSDDPLLSREVGQALFGILSTTRAHSEFSIVNRTGHFVFLDDPVTVARLVERFVAPCLSLSGTR
jgi:pimeloyl-ACP methyl ester carboxylesterase